MILFFVCDEAKDVPRRFIRRKLQMIHVPPIDIDEARLQDAIQANHAEQFIRFFPNPLEQPDILIARSDGMEMLRPSFQFRNALSEQIGMDGILEDMPAKSNLDFRIDHRVCPVSHHLHELHFDIPIASKEFKNLLNA